MDPPRIRLGSPIPITPPARRPPKTGGLQDLLRQFGSQNTPTSVTQSRRASTGLSTHKKPRLQSPRDGNDTTADMASANPRELRSRKPVTYTPVNDDSLPSPSASSAYDTPKKADFESDDEEELEEESFIPEETVVGGRSLRFRNAKSRNPLPELKQEAPSRRQPTRQSTRKANIILTSDTTEHEATGKPTISKFRPQKLDTARVRLREEIANQTKVKRDSFLAVHKDYFLPLLPKNNHISKLVSHGNESAQIVEYAELQEQPKGVTATMKPYQLSGLSFLVHLNNNGMSGLLGDEMGLGKTLQTLSLFQYLEERDEASSAPTSENRPYLVVCPLSVLNSWVSEARRWVPRLKVLRFHGPTSERNRLKKVASGQEDWFGNETTKSRRRKADRKAGKKVSRLPGDDTEANDDAYKIVVTTYETFASEQSWFKTAFVWRYVVLDEGHKIKNTITQISTALQGIQAEYRLILTGTPLQNNLAEMWALLHWLYPEVFVKTTDELFKASFDLNRGKVSTKVMDDARRLLELIMLRRMKNSSGVNLNLPPKEEVLLFVPLTPMQRFWYQRLLTGLNEGILDDVFKNTKEKEQEASLKEKEEEAVWKKAGELVDDAKPHGEWDETAQIIRQAIEQEQKDTTVKSAWQKLMNLLMQLRKCCSHPYLLPNGAPEPYTIGEHIIRASGKFILLEKLLKNLILEKEKKVLIFSSFTRTLDCSEDLLSLISDHGATFKHLRFEGATSRAHRNLSIRLFNDTKSEYKVMLLSTKAGGLGINLTSATEVIFLDEDWNPQVTLQAEARAHRIGQTKPVTIYKLCTQGTVEEQMMGRIRKKLYLSAKITESMRNIHGEDAATTKPAKRARPSINDDLPEMSTSQLKTLLRRGAQTLSHPEIDSTEMLSLDLDTMLEKCRDKPSDPHVHSDAHDDAATEEKWLSVMERVECAVFDGKRYQRNLENKSATANVLPTSVTREDRRKGKNTTVMVDGFAISKESLSCNGWEAVPTMAGKDPRLADVKRQKKREYRHEDHCHECYDGGELALCSGCPRSYHYGCLDDHFKAKAKGKISFFCPQHECWDCEKKTGEAGGIIFRCRWCVRGFCEDCLDWDKAQLVGDNLPEYKILDEPSVSQAFYVSCHICEHNKQDDETRDWFARMESGYQDQLAAKAKEEQNYMEGIEQEQEQELKVEVQIREDVQESVEVAEQVTTEKPSIERGAAQVQPASRSPADLPTAQAMAYDSPAEDQSSAALSRTSIAAEPRQEPEPMEIDLAPEDHVAEAYAANRALSVASSGLSEPPSEVNDEPPSLDGSLDTPATLGSGISTPKLKLKLTMKSPQGHQPPKDPGPTMSSGLKLSFKNLNYQETEKSLYLPFSGQTVASSSRRQLSSAPAVPSPAAVDRMETQSPSVPPTGSAANTPVRDEMESTPIPKASSGHKRKRSSRATHIINSGDVEDYYYQAEDGRKIRKMQSDPTVWDPAADPLLG